jgi:hypothetical protein
LFAVALLALLLALPAGAALAQSKSFVYDRISVDVDVRADGTLDVTEIMTLKYTGGPFSFVSRSIALMRLDEVRDVGLSEGQRAYTEASSGKTPGTFVAEQADGKLKVSWFYEPTSDATRTFTLRYRVLGAVRAGSEADEVWWVGIFPERSVPVQHARVAMHLPDGARLRAQDVTLPAASAMIEITNEDIVVTRDEPLSPGQSLDVRIDFDPALVSAQPPAWQSASPPVSETVAPQPASEPLGPLGWLIGGFFGLLSCFGVPLIIVAVLFVVIRVLIRGAGSSHSQRPAGWGSSSGSNWSSDSSNDSGSSSWSSSDSGSSWSSSDSGSGGGGGDAG